MDAEVSHYLWTLNNAVCGLITLCEKSANNQECVQKIISEVEKGLLPWAEYKGKCDRESITKHSNAKAQLRVDKEDEKETQVTQVTTAQTTQKANVLAWGDCSDEDDDDDDDDTVFPKAVGLCKPVPVAASKSTASESVPQANSQPSAPQPRSEPQPSDLVAAATHNEAVENDDHKSITMTTAIDDLKLDEDRKASAAADEADDDVSNEDDNNELILSGPLFIDDTNTTTTANTATTMTETKPTMATMSASGNVKHTVTTSSSHSAVAPSPSSPSSVASPSRKKSAMLSWAQRTKSKNIANLNSTPKAMTMSMPAMTRPLNTSSINHSRADEQHELSSIHSKESSSTVGTPSSSKQKQTKSKKQKQTSKATKQQPQPQVQTTWTAEEKGWSKVKHKMQQRYSSLKALNPLKTPQQKLLEAEQRKQLKLDEQKSRHQQIFEKLSKIKRDTEQKRNESTEERKKATQDRQLKAEENRKHSGLLRKEKLIKDEVRREEMRISQEWQQREMKAELMEKQIAAELRKLKRKQELTRKLTSQEEKFKDVHKKQLQQQQQQKETHDNHKKHNHNSNGNKAQKQHHKSQTKKPKKDAAKSSKSAAAKKKENVSHSHVQKQQQMLTWSESDMLQPSEIVGNENDRFYSPQVIESGLSTFLSIPKLSQVTTAVRDQIQHFYGKTKSLASHPATLHEKEYKMLEEAVRELLKHTVELNFEDIHYNDDVLVVLHRLTQFDVNEMPFKCAKLTVHNLVVYSMNTAGVHLLAVTYLETLLKFYHFCIAEYFYRNNHLYHSVLPQMCLVLSRVFSLLHEDDRRFAHDVVDYATFKQHSICAALLALCNASILIDFSNFFKALLSMPNGNSKFMKQCMDEKIFDGFISILIPIASLTKTLDSDSPVRQLLLQQLTATKCGGILNFMVKCVFYNNLNYADNKVIDNAAYEYDKFSSSTIALLNKCIVFLNAMCSIDLEMLSALILENEHEIYHILLILLEYTSNNFMIQIKDNKYDENNIRELCKGLLDFITYLSLNNGKIQDMFRNISNNKPTLLRQLCQFPFFFFINNDGKLSLFPALIAVTFNNQENLNLLANTVNSKHIHQWLRKNMFSYYDTIKKNQPLNGYQEMFALKIPTTMWSQCLDSY